MDLKNTLFAKKSEKRHPYLRLQNGNNVDHMKKVPKKFSMPPSQTFSVTTPKFLAVMQS